MYFVRASSSGLVKIGWAKDPATRTDMFRCGCPDELEVLTTLEGGRKLEAAYHRVFADCRVRGEWFWPTPALMEWIGYPHLGRFASEGIDVERERFLATAC